MKRKLKTLKTMDIAMIGISAALYALVGIITNMGLIAPVVGVVKFWPAVIVPGIFAVLFGPWVGGIGAAIGIFVADMVQPGHGIALLSLSVGVTSNFAGFFLVGYISKLKMQWKQIIMFLAVGSVALTAMMAYLFSINQMTFEILTIFLGVIVASDVIVIGFGLWRPEWKTYGLASVIGLLVGSAIIGFGLWGYSQILPLPLTTGYERNAPLFASFFWLIWTFATEIPFLVALVPPIAKVCYRAFPFLAPPETKK